jgi:hypothetical protein
MTAEHVYESVDALAYALHWQAQLDSFVPWQCRDPACKPVVSG